MGFFDKFFQADDDPEARIARRMLSEAQEPLEDLEDELADAFEIVVTLQRIPRARASEDLITGLAGDVDDLRQALNEAQALVNRLDATQQQAEQDLRDRSQR